MPTRAVDRAYRAQLPRRLRAHDLMQGEWCTLKAAETCCGVVCGNAPISGPATVLVCVALPRRLATGVLTFVRAAASRWEPS